MNITNREDIGRSAGMLYSVRSHVDNYLKGKITIDGIISSKPNNRASAVLMKVNHASINLSKCAVALIQKNISLQDFSLFLVDKYIFTGKLIGFADVIVDDIRTIATEYKNNWNNSICDKQQMLDVLIGRVSNGNGVAELFVKNATGESYASSVILKGIIPVSTMARNILYMSVEYEKCDDVTKRILKSLKLINELMCVKNF